MALEYWYLRRRDMMYFYGHSLCYTDSMKTICVSGLKNSGKTALIEALIPLLAAEGIRTVVIKHHGHGFVGEIPDKPGSDTYRFLAAGAHGTVIYDDEVYALVKRQAASVEDLTSLFPDADLILIEGAKTEPYPRIAMLRAGHTPASDTNGLLCAVTDKAYPIDALPPGLPRFDFGDFEGVAGVLLGHLKTNK